MEIWIVIAGILFLYVSINGFVNYRVSRKVKCISNLCSLLEKYTNDLCGYYADYAKADTLEEAEKTKLMNRIYVTNTCNNTFIKDLECYIPIYQKDLKDITEFRLCQILLHRMSMNYVRESLKYIESAQRELVTQKGKISELEIDNLFKDAA